MLFVFVFLSPIDFRAVDFTLFCVWAQIVLAGDPCQLGPIVKSKTASAFGLGVSLLERLMANPLYAKQEWGYNPMLVRALATNGHF